MARAGRIAWVALTVTCLWFLFKAKTIGVFMLAALGMFIILSLAIGWERRYSFIVSGSMTDHQLRNERWK